MKPESDKTNKRQLLLNLINHPNTPPEERTAAEEALKRIKKAGGQMILEGIIRRLGNR